MVSLPSAKVPVTHTEVGEATGYVVVVAASVDVDVIRSISC